MRKENGIAKGLLIAALCLGTGILVSQTREVKIAKTMVVGVSKQTQLPNFIKLNNEVELTGAQFQNWFTDVMNVDAKLSLKNYRTTTDRLGYTHTRYHQYYNNFLVVGTDVIAHSKNGKIVSVGGGFFQEMNPAATTSLTEAQALQKALNKINAEKYMWENKAHEKNSQNAFKNPNFSFYPKGELVIVHKKGAAYTASDFYLAYKFNIYAEVPLYRANVFVDANTGEILDEQNLICHADVVGTANTKYSGNVAMTSDNYGTNQFRLRETGRGQGIETYNLQNSTTYTNTDFTNTSANWNVTGTDQAASDAHWGAEKTYDYFMQIHSMNSIDGNGYPLISYVHYSNNFVNAFWDGQEMTYGDGNPSQGYNIMTALDVCGHEITHGLTENWAGLNGGEADALNEAFSDIFGTTIEFFARPGNCDWLMGADLTTSGNGLRNMANPNSYNDPDTYQGNNWDAGGEPHANAGPADYWYYLLTVGGSGTNDNGDAYNVTGIGMGDAADIAFLALTQYFTQGTDYADARVQTLTAAELLFGPCSQQYMSCTNAWYAVGVGAQYSPTGVAAAFNANMTSTCALPANINFTNTTSAGLSYTWDFGDGTTSTTNSPSHTYTLPGTYTVKLVATGCSSGLDSIIKTSYITINPPTAPATTGAAVCVSGALNLSASGSGTLNWYTTAGGGTPVATGTNYTTPTLTATTTYYVSSSIVQTPVTGGPLTNTTIGSGGYNQYSHYLVFDANQPLTIQTVDVWANSTGTRTFELQSSNGTTLSTISVNLTNTGKTTVTLNFHVNPGSNYRLATTGSTFDLYRNNAGASFPYTIGTLISITGTDVTATNPAYYYWFYNWVVLKDPCVSAATPVTATINNCSGIESLNTAELSVYPNPANDLVTIKSANGMVTAKIYDQTGREVMSQVQQAGTDNLKINIAQLAEGVYYLNIRDKEKMTGRKLIIQR